MAGKRRTVAWLVGSALVLSVCGDRGPAAYAGGGPGAAPPARAAAQVPEDLARLVAPDAFGVVYAPSLDRLVEKLRSLVGAVDAQAAQKVEVGSMLQEIAGPAAPQVDVTRAMAIVLAPGPGRDAPPAPTFLLPVKDPAAAKAAFGEVPPGKPAPVVVGTYLVLSQAPGFAAQAAPSALLRDLPAGDVAVRLDLGRLIAAYRPMIDEAMGAFTKGTAGGGAAAGGAAEMPGLAGAQQMLAGLVGFAKTLLDSAERLDLAVRIDGGNAAFDVHFTAKAGSALERPPAGKGDVAAVAACLPGDYPFVVLMGGGLRETTEWSLKLSDLMLASLPEAQRAAFKGLMTASKDMLALLGDEMALAYRFGEGGMEMVEVLSSKDPKAYLARLDDMMRGQADALAAMGMKPETLPATTVAGVEVREWAWTVDVEKLMAAGAKGSAPSPAAVEGARRAMTVLFGSGRLRVRGAAVGGHVVLAMGGPDDVLAKAIEATKAPGKPSATMSSLIAAAGDHPTVLLTVEARELAAGVLALMRKAMPEGGKTPLPEPPAGGPVRLTAYGTVEGREYSGTLVVDVAAVAQLVRGFAAQMKEKEGAATPPSGPK